MRLLIKIHENAMGFSDSGSNTHFIGCETSNSYSFPTRHIDFSSKNMLQAIISYYFTKQLIYLPFLLLDVAAQVIIALKHTKQLHFHC